MAPTVAAASEVASAPSPPSTPWVGGQSLFDQYEVEIELGAGGMGKVYRVRNSLTGGLFAVKRATVTNAEQRRQWMTELLTWIDLPDHPNLVACKFFRTVGSEIVIFAEHVGGGTLDDRLARWRRDGAALQELLDCALQSAWALKVLHARGVVHRDMKPANVLLGGDGVIKLTDFGISSAVESSFGPGAHTPAYASPEQRRGDRVDAASDVFSWGATVLELFAGERTWTLGDAAPDALADLSPPPEWPVLPPTTRALLERCLAHDAGKRPSMDEATRELLATFDAGGGPYRRALVDVHPRRRSQRRDVRAERVLAPFRSANVVALHPPETASQRTRAVADLANCDDAVRWASASGSFDAANPEHALAFVSLLVFKGEIHELLDDLAGASRSFDGALALQSVVERAGVDGKRDIARALLGKATIARKRGHAKEAIDLYVQAERRATALDASALLTVAEAAFGRGLTFGAADDPIRAMAQFERAARVLGDELRTAAVRLVAARHERGPEESPWAVPALLVDVLLEHARAAIELEDLDVALSKSSDAMRTLDPLVTSEDPDVRRKVGVARLVHLDVLFRRGDHEEALRQGRAAIEVLEPLVEDGIDVAAGELARAYLETARLTTGARATELADAAIALTEQFVVGGGRDALAPTLGSAYMRRGALAAERRDSARAVDWYTKAFGLFDRIRQERPKETLLPLTDAALARWLVMRELDVPQLLAEWRRVVALLDEAFAAFPSDGLDVVRHDVRLMRPWRRG